MSEETIKDNPKGMNDNTKLENKPNDQNDIVMTPVQPSVPIIVASLNETKTPKIVQKDDIVPVSDSKRVKDPNMCSVITLSIGIAFVFFGFNTAQNFASSILGDLGTISMAIVYLVNSLCNFIVPSVVDLFPSERKAMAWFGLEYFVYIATFIYLIPIVSVLWSALHGFTSSVLCAVQGIVLQSYSTDSDRGKKSGIFFSIYMAGSALGNIMAYFLLDLVNADSDQAKEGWTGVTSILFIVLSIACFIGDMIIHSLKAPIFPSVISNIHTEKKSKKTVGKRICDIWNLIISPKMRLLLFMYLNDGYANITLCSQITRQIKDTKYVGIFMCIFSICDVLFSNICGRLSDKYGHKLILSLSMISQVIGLLLGYIGNYFDILPLMYLCSVFFALQDGALQTECLNVTGEFFKSQRDEANCIFRMFQCLGGGLCFIISPLFVVNGEKSASNTMFLIELCLSFFVCILGYIFYLLFDCHIKHQLLHTRNIKNEI